MNRRDERVHEANERIGLARVQVHEASRLAGLVGDAYAEGALAAAFAALGHCTLVTERLKPAANLPQFPARLTPAERYQTDPAFHLLVDFLRGMLGQGDYTPSELREAVILAATIHEADTIRRAPFWTGGGPFEG